MGKVSVEILKKVLASKAKFKDGDYYVLFDANGFATVKFYDFKGAK